MGYGVGLLGLVAIKVLAPGYYASQDIRTPVRIAVAVLVMTQVFNWVLVPYLAHAGLALSIGLGALVNAGWLLLGLRQKGAYLPNPGWGRFVLQVLVGCAVLGAWLFWAAHHWDWTALYATPWLRMALMTGVLAVSAALYFVSLTVLGVKLRALLRR
jgi:putative peptidoglycan lipid II flippase